MRYNLLKHSSRNFITLLCNITSQHNTSHSFSHHSRTQRSKHNITIANALFKANPPISPEVLTKAFQVDQKLIDDLQKKSWYDMN